MHLKFALVALLALTGITGPAPRIVDALTGPGAPAAARDAVVDAAVPTGTGAAGDGNDGVSLEEKSIVVPPVTSDVAETPSASPSVAAPEPQANPDVVVADQLVSAERVESEVVDAAGFQTIGVTWPEGAEVGDLGGQVRTQTDGTWSEWIDLQPGDDAPDAGTADAANAVRGGTDPVSIGDADAVQLAFTATPDGGPAGLSLALVGSAETSASDGVVGTAANGKAAIQSASFTTGMLKTAAAPRVISRAEWGAPAQVCAPDVASKLVGAVVHHTAGSNSYSSVAEAMQQIRNDAAYHISGRGWCDIGYNFIVDKWGNIYEGRANSMTQAVIGVHAGGFNTGTLGVSMLGTYDSAPSSATQQAVGQIIGWRLGAYRVDPQGWMNYYTGAGENSKYQNQNVTIPRVIGHRDVAYTACPGNGGYAALANIRAIAASVIVNEAPIGQVDTVSTGLGTITISGWTLDPDTSTPNQAHVYIDGVGVAVTANLSRPDIGAAFGKGNDHGFTHTRTVTSGDHSVCVFSIDSAGWDNTLIDCRTVTVGTLPRTPPIGGLDVVSASNTALAVSGWSLDPDTTDPNDVHIYVDGIGTAVRADQPRPDIAAAFGKGDRHGFTYTPAAAPGRHEVCVYSINTGPGGHTLLGCRTVNVVDQLPLGSVDAITASNTAITVTGWALDPDTQSSIEAHVYIDGVGVALRANGSRPDLAAAFGMGTAHGFTGTFPVKPGNHNVCVFAINTSLGANVTLTCRNVAVLDYAPIGSVDSVTAGSRSVTVRGWTLDLDGNASNEAHVYIDGVGVAALADRPRQDIAAAFGHGDRHGFDVTTSATPGQRTICVFGINTSQGANTLLNCRTIVVPS